MPKIDPATAPAGKGSSYPAPFDEPCKGRAFVRLGLAADLTQFGINLVTLEPGAWSSQRHWHAKEDEFVYVIEGEVTLVEDGGEWILKAGDSIGWKGGVKNGHHLINHTERDAKFLAVGTRDDDDWGEYPDVDLKFGPGRYSGKPTARYTRKNGTPY